ncbi:TGB2 [Allium carlavirus A]|nr:TGB2 [Allium carlavirus A]
MPLSPPPDNTKTLLACAVGATFALCLYTLTRSTLPHVGDNIHHLPHGGCYQDGTKKIYYNKPHQGYPSSNLFSGTGSVFMVVCFLILAIYFSERYSRGRVNARSRCCLPNCATQH